MIGTEMTVRQQQMQCIRELRLLLQDPSAAYKTIERFLVMERMSGTFKFQRWLS